MLLPRYVIAHTVEDLVFDDYEERIHFFESFDLHFIGLVLMTIMLFFALSLAFLYTYERLSTRSQPSRMQFRMISKAIFDSTRTDNFVYRLTNYGFIVFVFITLNFLQNNIKTNKARKS